MVLLPSLSRARVPRYSKSVAPPLGVLETECRAADKGCARVLHVTSAKALGAHALYIFHYENNHKTFYVQNEGTFFHLRFSVDLQSSQRNRKRKCTSMRCFVKSAELKQRPRLEPAGELFNAVRGDQAAALHVLAVSMTAVKHKVSMSDIKFIIYQQYSRALIRSFKCFPISST